MPNARDRARAAVLADITEVAGRHLAETGPAGLSVRAIARDLGMVSSGIYRYVASRDELLTLLIVDAYGRLAAAVEVADPGEGTSARDRFLAVTAAVRAWALTDPHRYGLLYGTPVPGYAAPAETIDPASRLYRALLAPLIGAAPVAAPDPSSLPAADLAAFGALVPGLDPAVAAVAVEVWAALFGAISLEVFGHTSSTLSDPDAWFMSAMQRQATLLGLEP